MSEEVFSEDVLNDRLLEVRTFLLQSVHFLSQPAASSATANNDVTIRD